MCSNGGSIRTTRLDLQICSKYLRSRIYSFFSVVRKSVSWVGHWYWNWPVSWRECVFPSRRGGQPRRANDIADEPPHRYPRRIRHKAPAPFSSSFRDDSNHPRGRSAVPPPRLSRSRSLPARPSAPEMTDDQLADSTYSEAVAASLLGVQILRSFPGPHYYGQRVPGP